MISKLLSKEINHSGVCIDCDNKSNRYYCNSHIDHYCRLVNKLYDIY